MRVLLDCRMASWTGVGRYTHGIVRALARRGGLDLVQVIADGQAPPAEGGEVLTVSRHPFGLSGARELGSLVRRAKPDVTHCLHFPTPTPIPHPLAVTLHDLSPLLVDGVMPSAIKRAVYRRWNVRALRGADAVIAVSQHTAGDLRQLVPSSAAKIRVIVEAADDFTAGASGGLPSEFAGSPYVLSFGNTKPHKDLPTLIRAFSRLATEDPRLRLLLVGPDQPGYVEEVLRGSRADVGEAGDMVSPAEAASRIRFTGWVGDATLRALYANAAAFAFPSLYEGFGLPPLEAMSVGTPVVVAAASSLPEVVGDAALAFPPGDASALAAALARVLRDTRLRDDLVERGRARAASFTWDRAAAETHALYEELAASSSGTASSSAAGTR